MNNFLLSCEFQEFYSIDFGVALPRGLVPRALWACLMPRSIPDWMSSNSLVLISFSTKLIAEVPSAVSLTPYSLMLFLHECPSSFVTLPCIARCVLSRELTASFAPVLHVSISLMRCSASSSLSFVASIFPVTSSISWLIPALSLFNCFLISVWMLFWKSDSCFAMSVLISYIMPFITCLIMFSIAGSSHSLVASASSLPSSSVFVFSMASSSRSESPFLGFICGLPRPLSFPPSISRFIWVDFSFRNVLN